MQLSDESVSGLVSAAFVYISSLKMAVPLPNFTAVEQRAVVNYLRSEGVKAFEIHRRLLAQYCEHCKALKNLHESVDGFKCGRTTLDEERSVDLRYYE